jgi:hypothetical protein
MVHSSLQRAVCARCQLRGMCAWATQRGEARRVVK